MKLQVIATFIIFSSLSPIFSQQEIYLDNTPKEKIKLTNLKGIEFSGTVLNDNEILNPYALEINYQFNYFQELRLFSSVGLVLKGGMIMRKRIFMGDFIGNDDDMAKLFNTMVKRTYGEVHVLVEPRWYFSFFHRQKEGKAMLNSGWYIGMPIDLYSDFSTYYGFRLNPTLGFRQAITKSLFIEGGLGVVPIFGRNWSTLAPNASLKLAYCL